MAWTLRDSWEVLDLARTAPVQEVRSHVVELLTAKLGVDGVAFYDFGPNARASANTVVRDLAVPLLDRIDRSYARVLEELVPVLPAMQDDRVARRRDLPWAGESMWKEIFDSLGVRDTLSVWIDRGARGPAMIAMVRTSKRGFGERERETVRLIEPALAMAERSAAMNLPVDLTRAQRRIVEYVRLGLTNREIATALGVSPLTVRNQLSLVYERLDVANRTELVARLS